MRSVTPAMTHEGRLALVTGAGQGIGQAIALALAARGARVIATDLALPQETVSKIGPRAFGLELDVSHRFEDTDGSETRDLGRVLGDVEAHANVALRV